MKKLLKFFLGIILLSTLIFYVGNLKMFKTTNYFIEQLSTSYRSYGLDGFKYAKAITNFNSPMQITPIGRLIIVKFDIYVRINRYHLIRTTLKIRYIFDNRVNDIYINNGGTICIDCRR